MRALAGVALLLAGCGGAVHGQATLWVTRDRGAHVLLVAHVPAGLTAIQALERKAKVETRYGGRFVQAIDSVQGSLGAQRDWFYFVNGYEADRGAAEYRLHPGDVEWWDYRSWKNAAHVPVVVGAFPEPFLHGYDGKRRRTFVVGTVRAAAARAVARAVRGRVIPLGTFIPSGASVLVVDSAPRKHTRFEARLLGNAPGAPVQVIFSGNARDLLAHRFRYRYEVRP